MTVVSNLRSRHSDGNKNTMSTGSNGAHLGTEGSDSPQVLFMDTSDVRNRTGHVPSSYYQVATPKSPHDLSLMDEAEEVRTGPSHHDHRESEESERLKYETAKHEIMENLNLHIMLKNNEHTELESELGRIEAQMRVLEYMHQDSQLMKHVGKRQEELYTRHREEFTRRKEREAFRTSLNGVDPLSAIPSSRPGAESGHGGYFYHTRSKSAHNVNIGQLDASGNDTHLESRLRPASGKFEGKGLPEGKTLRVHDQQAALGSELDPVRPSLLNQHQKRNYSSSCLTSKSGVVGSNEKNEPIFKRPDGILVIIACSFCERSGFTSAQGIVNHVRLKHATSYPSQPLAVLKNQQVLPDSRQATEIIAQFKSLHLDPQHDYLPHVINIQTSVNAVGHKDRRASSRELSPRAMSLKVETRPDGPRKSTRHLRKLYPDEDFKEIVHYVNDAQKDLDCILKQPSETEDSGESGPDDDVKVERNQSSLVTSNSNGNIRGSKDNREKESSSETSPDHKRRKSSSPELDTGRKRYRAAEKKVRPDAIALMKIPERDKRSSHYNLRAKSKLRGHNRYD
ncbi:Ahc1p LALA0_S09e01178g [Lachancea lanzarotensis]|uniref:LALA0S09e01178g1_1 n=1 Tax=Lachancea lanzarotensis TaxID=1245769 RepID=A0A0C7N734_9SACH|nr:uncharacterized protein LALA0_S09e01178g [Lachancea lanzarotensis]CEP63728.1 LALA0S09e01178g1_1 [Lachancea lanzarotensis]